MILACDGGRPRFADAGNAPRDIQDASHPVDYCQRLSISLIANQQLLVEKIGIFHLRLTFHAS
jgi:hypothetical protein